MKERQEKIAARGRERQEKIAARGSERQEKMSARARELQQERQDQQAAREKQRQEKEVAFIKKLYEKQAARERERQEKQATREKERREKDVTFIKKLYEKQAARPQEKQARPQEKQASREKKRQEKQSTREMTRREKDVAFIKKLYEKQARPQEKQAARERERQEKQATREKTIADASALALSYVTKDNVSAPSKLFTAGSQHKIRTNFNPVHRNESEVAEAKLIFESYILESSGSVLDDGATVKVTDIIHDENGSADAFEVLYEIVPHSDSNTTDGQLFSSLEQSSLTSSLASTKKSSLRYHYSIRTHLIEYGSGSLEYLRSLGLVESLGEAERVADRTRSRGGGVYTEATIIYPFDSEPHPADRFGKTLTVSNRDNIDMPVSWTLPPHPADKFGKTITVSNRTSIDDQLKIDKHGSTNNLSRRFNDSDYGGKADLRVRVEGEELPVDADAGLCALYDAFFQAVMNDPNIPIYIKRAFCIKLRERGGERMGGKKTIIYQLLEQALQRENGHGVLCEGFQWDDNVFVSEITAVRAALGSIAHILQLIGPRSDIATASMMNWPPGKGREDQIYNTLVATDYTGVSSKHNAIDVPAIPDWTTQDERYSTNYSSQQFFSGKQELAGFIEEAWSHRHTGCLYLLNKNELICGKAATTINALLAAKGFEIKATLYDEPDDIILYLVGKAAIAVHGSLCIAGTILDCKTIEQKQGRCRVLDTLRCMVARARGEPIDGPMLAIEAGMMQRAVCKGLNLHSINGAVYFRDYLTPDDVNAFDLFGGNQYGPWKHYLDYPITECNRALYRRN